MILVSISETCLCCPRKYPFPPNFHCTAQQLTDKSQLFRRKHTLCELLFTIQTLPMYRQSFCPHQNGYIRPCAERRHKSNTEGTSAWNCFYKARQDDNVLGGSTLYSCRFFSADTSVHNQRVLCNLYRSVCSAYTFPRSNFVLWPLKSSFISFNIC
jgi:hypothetical protein